MAKTKPGNITIDEIIKDIESGLVKIPRFQRKFVWSKKNSAKLMDSIIKGFPVGVFIYWKTKEKLRVVKNIGDLQLPETPDDDFIYYVLDGQQRITSIYASAVGAKLDEDFSELFVDLTATYDDDIVIEDIEGVKDTDYIPLKDVINLNLPAVNKKYPSDKVEKIFEYNQTIAKYAFSKIDLTEASLNVATDIFTRINTSGKSLTVFEIMCAKMYSETKGFDLYEKREAQKAAWENVGYETISDVTVLQAMGACINKKCKSADILELDQDDFINAWDKVSKAFDDTIDYFKNSYGIPVSKLLPYDALIVPFVYYFFNHSSRPTGVAQKRLQDYFWRAIFSLRFTEGALSKTESDLVNVIDRVLKGKAPTYDYGVDISVNSIKKNGVFSLGSAFVKGIVCILSGLAPVSFIDGHVVTIDNAWLSQGNSKNYHHFFPKAYMKNNHPLTDDNLVNHVANITIVDSWLNKTKIKAKAPSKYISEFENEMTDPNDLQSNLKTHLINDIDAYGIRNDDYDTFFNKRVEAINNEIKNKLIKQPLDVF